MSVRANPTAIGAFLLGAAALIVVGLAILASASWFQHRTQFVSFFGESINGLEVGAPVKYQGVPIGSVTGVAIQIDRVGKTFQVPVQYEIELEKLVTVSGSFVDLSDATTRAQQVAD